MEVVHGGDPETKNTKSSMKRTSLYLLPALCVGVNSTEHALALSAAAPIPKVIAVPEGAVTLNEVTGFVPKPGSWFGAGTRIRVAVQVATWSRALYGAERGIPYMHSFEYRHYPVFLNSIYVHQQMVNGVFKTEYTPFPITALETRDMTCLRRTGTAASWEIRKARFTLAARSTVLERVGLFSNEMGPWACTVVASRQPMPSSCTPVEDEASQECRVVSVQTGGLTYFTFDRSGNYSYGVPEIFLGARDGARNAPLASNPSIPANGVNNPVTTLQSNAIHE